MNISRAVGLIASIVLAIVVGGPMAAGASAQPSSVEVVDEATAEPCSPCPIHVVGESHIIGVGTGIVFVTCEDELEGTINHDGTGAVIWIGNAHGAPGCVPTCLGAGESIWELSALGELPGGNEQITLRSCVRIPAGDIHCSLVLDVEHEAESHHLLFSTDQLCYGGSARFEGLWEGETTEHNEIELVHAGS